MPTTFSTSDKATPVHSAMNDHPSSHACCVICERIGSRFSSSSENDEGRATSPFTSRRHSAKRLASIRR
jgi:hypothetical protein